MIPLRENLWCHWHTGRLKAANRCYPAGLPLWYGPSQLASLTSVTPSDQDDNVIDAEFEQKRSEKSEKPW